MIKEIGCCGAYCKTCREYIDMHCLGCKLGYENGERDLNKIRCKIKLCCYKENKFAICADCLEYTSCKTIHDFYDKNGYKYQKYRQATEYIRYIREKGYDCFLRITDNWKGAYDKFD